MRPTSVVFLLSLLVLTGCGGGADESEYPNAHEPACYEPGPWPACVPPIPLPRYKETDDGPAPGN